MNAASEGVSTSASHSSYTPVQQAPGSSYMCLSGVLGIRPSVSKTAGSLAGKIGFYFEPHSEALVRAAVDPNDELPLRNHQSSLDPGSHVRLAYL